MLEELIDLGRRRMWRGAVAVDESVAHQGADRAWQPDSQGQAVTHSAPSCVACDQLLILSAALRIQFL